MALSSLRYFRLDIIGMISSKQNGAALLKYAQYLSMLTPHGACVVLRFLNSCHVGGLRVEKLSYEI